MEQDLELNEELETEAEQEQKFTICISDDGYYAEGLTEYFVEVTEIPYVEDARHLKAYKYEDGTLILDDARLEEIKTEISQEEIPISPEERIAMLEEQNEMLTSCILEMSEIVYGG